MLLDVESSSGSGVDSGEGSGERPSLSRDLFSFSCSSFLLLFLSWLYFSASFHAFCASTCWRFAARASGSGGSETYPWRLRPYERNENQKGEMGDDNTND